MKEKDCPVHSAQESLPHPYSSAQSKTPVPWGSTVLAVNRNFSISHQCLEIETDTDLEIPALGPALLYKVLKFTED